jgi:hypothetical protein
MGTPGKLLIGALALIAAVALFVVLRDDGGSDATTTTTQADVTTTPAAEQPKPEKPEKPEEPEVATIVVENGRPVGGIAELEFAKGDQIRFVVESDVADHVHLHGYDVFRDIAAGGKAEFDVPATIEGVFEVELEDRVVPLAEITVTPG